MFMKNTLSIDDGSKSKSKTVGFFSKNFTDADESIMFDDRYSTVAINFYFNKGNLNILFSNNFAAN